MPSFHQFCIILSSTTDECSLFSFSFFPSPLSVYSTGSACRLPIPPHRAMPPGSRAVPSIPDCKLSLLILCQKNAFLIFCSLEKSQYIKVDSSFCLNWFEKNRVHHHFSQYLKTSPEAVGWDLNSLVSWGSRGSVTDGFSIGPFTGGGVHGLVLSTLGIRGGWYQGWARRRSSSYWQAETHHRQIRCLKRLCWWVPLTTLYCFHPPAFYL